MSATGNYLFDLSKPIMKYATDKAAQGMQYLYRQMTGKSIDEDNEIDRREGNKGNDNIINEENEGASSSIFFEKGEIFEDNPNDNRNYPTLSQVNKPNEDEKDCSNNSAAPITLKP